LGLKGDSIFQKFITDTSFWNKRHQIPLRNQALLKMKVSLLQKRTPTIKKVNINLDKNLVIIITNLIQLGLILHLLLFCWIVDNFITNINPNASLVLVEFSLLISWKFFYDSVENTTKNENIKNWTKHVFYERKQKIDKHRSLLVYIFISIYFNTSVFTNPSFRLLRI
jgi:hypothetical protein